MSRSSSDKPGEQLRTQPAIKPSAPKHSALSIVIANLPYAVMILLGATIVALSLKSLWWAWIAAAAYLAYGILGALWIIVFLCPYCPSYAKRSCPCGYGLLAAKLRPTGDTALFRKKFRRHIPVIVPLWLIPALLGGVVMASAFSWPLAILLGAFVLNSFVILPLAARSHGCKDCPQREACPWMNR